MSLQAAEYVFISNDTHDDGPFRVLWDRGQTLRGGHRQQAEVHVNRPLQTSSPGLGLTCGAGPAPTEGAPTDTTPTQMQDPMVSQARTSPHTCSAEPL